MDWNFIALDLRVPFMVLDGLLNEIAAEEIAQAPDKERRDL